jgi:pSer/pThr/pTyr-binding forkhead associated (FHA) protein
VNRPQQLVFGTDSTCDVRVNDPYVSPRHLRVTRTPDGAIWVEDLGSSNGTWIVLAGVRILRVQGLVRLHQGAAVQIGRTLIPWGREGT